MKKNSFIQVDKNDNFYQLHYEGSYHFTDLLKYAFNKSPNAPLDRILGVTTDEGMKKFLSQTFYRGKVLPFAEWSPNGGCDSFNSWNPQTNSWNFSRNFDYWYNKDELDADFLNGKNPVFTTNKDFNWRKRPASAIVHTCPKEKLEIHYRDTKINEREPVESMSLVYLPFMTGNFDDPRKDRKFWKIAPYFAFDGINKNGVSISINVSGNRAQTHQYDTVTYLNSNCNKINLNSFAFVRLVLDYATSVDDAIKLMNNFYLNDMDFENHEAIHYQITDKNGNSAIIEFTEDYGFPTVVVRPTYVAYGTEKNKTDEYIKGYLTKLKVQIPGDTQFDYSIAGTDKYFQINENFNVYNLKGDLDVAHITDWKALNKHVETDLIQNPAIFNGDLRWSENYGRYWMLRNKLSEVHGNVSDPMHFLADTRMFRWNSWSVVYDLNNFSAQVVYMQQYNKPAYTFKF